MESRTYIKNLRISAKKLRFLANDIKKHTPFNALAALHYSDEKAGYIFYKAIKSAISNAKLSLKTSDDLLRFKTLLIEEGQVLKRYRAGGRGMTKQFARKTAHIKIILTAQAAPKKEEPKKVESKTAVKIEEPKKKDVKPASVKTMAGKKVTK